ncbi:ABC transporter ATP-binding protein/permease [Sansalvadorimonas sp. 2012CJ34-2]|uniref:ABC transporter ATP-binding protein/permease n=1 Tax=Parendozoicomonas callyspongiae TaxID=2942213 RepID=A0ABT0PHS4_9GAMM|nr:ABC transporter ATP-binding protein [Sansalvadorimonas sp. 2012CJ34-2]MCL6270924.1 ABC transporter ATP-binding protein/permease [Sansalvadorimonas sp. 2012CJ34-2]
MSDSSPPVQVFSWRRIRHTILGFRKELVTANIVAVLATLTSVPTPLLLPLLVDEVLLGQPGVIVNTLSSFLPENLHMPQMYVGVVLVVTLLLRALTLFFNIWQTRQFTIISKNIVYKIRQSLLKKLGRVSMTEYEILGSGSVASRFVTDLNTIDVFIASTVSRLLVASLTLIGTAVVLLWLHWQLALLILILNPVVIYLTSNLGKRIKELKKYENRAFDIFQEALTETLDGILQIRAANREKHYLARLLDKARNVRDAGSDFAWRNDAATRSSFMLFVVCVDLFRAAAMLTVVFSDLTIGQMFAVFGYLWFMMTPVNELVSMQYGLYAANAALGRINGLLQLGEEAQYSLKQDPFYRHGTVGLDINDVHFSYGDKSVLNGVSLSIAPGEKVALVGASGGGKSTLVKVLLGLYPLLQGRISIGGVELSGAGIDNIREHIAIVLQHPALFNTTVRENLTLGREVGDDELWQALKVAQLKERIQELELGLDSLVGNQGIRLSGGQRQRLAIARMIVSNPKVVILDEATSALDAETELRLHQALADFLSRRTTLIIAHRLSAIKQADRVYVFENGVVCEEGGHQQLLQQNGLYARLYGNIQEQRHTA